MGRVFDPYHKWLGIPPEEQPPSHYRLLGLKDLEADPDVVQSAADQRMAHLRTFQTGQYADWSQRLLNEVASARICLLNAAKKAAYDQQLQETMQAAAQPQEEPTAAREEFAIVVDEPGPRVSSLLRAKKRMPLGTIVTGSITLAGALILGLVYWNAGPPEGPVTAAKLQADKSITRETPGSVARKTEKPNDRPDAQRQAKGAAVSSSSNTTRDEDVKPEKRTRAKLSIKPESAPPETTEDSSSSKPRVNERGSTENAPSLSEQIASESMATERAAVPTDAAQEEAMRLARDLYRDEFTKAKTADEKTALAKKLLAQADAASNADAGAFVLLRLAKDFAVQASNGETAFAAIDLMAERYRIDAVGMKAELLSTYAKKSRAAPQHLSIAEQAARLLDEASDAGDYEQAVNLARLTAAEAALGRNKELAQWAKNCVQDLQKKAALVAAFEPAQETLVTQPDDPAANLVAGTYYGYLQENWEKALPYLAKGDDSDLQSLAKRELQSPTTSDARIALADAWWDMGQNAEGTKRLAMLRYAGLWYTKAHSDALSGLDKAKVEKRLEELAKAEHDAAPVGLAPKLVVPIGKWFSLLPSPNQLTGWEVGDSHFSYANRIIDLRQRDMYCPIIAKDVSIRAKVQRHNASTIYLVVRNSAQGCYIAQLTSAKWSIIKLTRPKAQNRPGGQFIRWGEEDTLNSIAVTRNYSDVVFKMGFTVLGNTLTVFLNGQPLLQAQDATFSEGCVGIGTTDSTGLFVADVELRVPKGSLVEDRRTMVGPAKTSSGR